MTTAKEHARHTRAYADAARGGMISAGHSNDAFALVMHAQGAHLDWTMALVELLRFFDALPEPVAIPPVPQPSEEAKRRGLLVGAVVRDPDGNLGRIVSHGLAVGAPLVQWAVGAAWVWGARLDRLTVIRPAPATREPNAEAVKRGLYIGARVMCDGKHGEIIAWDVAGDPIVDRGPRLIIDAWSASLVTLTGDAS